MCIIQFPDIIWHHLAIFERNIIVLELLQIDTN